MYEDITPDLPENNNSNVPQEPTEIYTTNLIFPEIPQFDDLIPIVKEDIYDNNEGFILYNVLSPKECEYVINTSEELGIGPLSYDKSFRNNDRCVAIGRGASNTIFNRIKDYILQLNITTEDDHHVGYSFKCEGDWKPIGLNTFWRICRYAPGGHFGPHYDAHYYVDTNNRSMKTFMIYLNDEYEGGTTNFINDSQPLFRDQDGLFKAQEENILRKIKPIKGMALIFNHHILHEGGIVSQGTKYIMRSDILFNREIPPPIDPKEEQALHFLKLAEVSESQGDLKKAVEYYKKAYKLCPNLQFVNK